MIVHTIWLGSDIPIRYHSNIKTHQQLNPGFHFTHWSDNDVIKLLTEYNLLDLYYTLNFISKFNLAKYIILDKFGGVFTDLDIKWKKPFIQIMNEYNFNDVDLILTHNNSISFLDPTYQSSYIDNQSMILLDDPFIISKPGVLKKCIDYRIGRKPRIDPKTNQIHKVEPIGPFLLTDWVYYNKIKISVFGQTHNLDWNGYYGNHEQLGLWN
jgi:hypothetical protein